MPEAAEAPVNCRALIHRDCRCANRDNFTLIEMLIVIAIVLVLCSMLLPALSKGLQSARKLSCLNNQKSLYIASENYGADYHHYFPAPLNLSAETDIYQSSLASITGAKWGWTNQMAIYFVENFSGGPRNWGNALIQNWSTFSCPEDSRGKVINTNKPALSYQLTLSLNSGDLNNYTPGVKKDRLRNFSQTVYLTDNDETLPGYANSICGSSDGTAMAYLIHKNSWSSRHANFPNTLFADGHITPVNRDYLQILPVDFRKLLTSQIH